MLCYNEVGLFYLGRNNMFSERLRFLRETTGLSQIELAKKIGVAASTYRNYENTSREPNYDTLVKIASVLEVSTDFLLGAQQSEAQNDRLMLAISQLPKEAMPYLYDYVNYLGFKYRIIDGKKK